MRWNAASSVASSGPLGVVQPALLIDDIDTAEGRHGLGHRRRPARRRSRRRNGDGGRTDRGGDLGRAARVDVQHCDPCAFAREGPAMPARKPEAAP